ncbi:PREDICTED: uncharacterized protein LOC103319292 [Prunus mume]|uniref:Uncharacterized protein LOC103319292 n=1 Tax=Prunus mume TaxID=102107 RepID=A0ABM1LHR0_PRUMU|nr:PREDICTED: uncharacterized protein LOC103319292 [Prunus mume]
MRDYFDVWTSLFSLPAAPFRASSPSQTSIATQSPSQPAGPDPIAPASFRRQPQPTPTPAAVLIPPENHENCQFSFEISRPLISVIRPPNRTSEAPEHQLTRRRDLQKAQQARTSRKGDFS